MAGFLSGSSSMTVLTVDKPETFSMDRLRENAFRDEGPMGEKRLGFVGLGDMFDTDNFSLALCDGTMAGFSFRVDEQKPSASAVKLAIDKQCQKEKEISGKKFISRTRRKEIAEIVISDLKRHTPYSPTVVDCIWDEKKKRLYAGTTNKKMLEGLQAVFDRAFGMFPDVLEADNELAVSSVFNGLARGWDVLEGYELTPLGDAVFVGGPEDEDGTVVSIKDSDEIMKRALEGNMEVVKLRLSARVSGRLNVPFAFTASQKLGISGLRFPKPEKGQALDATFVINAAICQSAADIVVAIASHNVGE